MKLLHISIGAAVVVAFAFSQSAQNLPPSTDAAPRTVGFGLVHPTDLVWITGSSTTVPVLGKVDDPYVVPAGKILAITGALTRSTNLDLQAEVQVDGDAVWGIETYDTGGFGAIRPPGPIVPGIAIEAGRTVEITNDVTGTAVVTGYLVSI